jgi:exodeoxyribonuclease VII small subunit
MRRTDLERDLEELPGGTSQEVPGPHAERAPALMEENKPQDFEGALKRLEEIVKELEAGDLSLEQSLERYEQGVGLARFCRAKLHEAERKIATLHKDDSGEVRLDASGQPLLTPLELEPDD